MARHSIPFNNVRVVDCTVFSTGAKKQVSTIMLRTSPDAQFLKVWPAYVPPSHYTVTLLYEGPGFVTGAGTYEEGSEVTITAIPQSHARFVRWDDGSTDPQRVITVNSDVTLTAYFEVVYQFYYVILSADGEGDVTGGGRYAEGAQAVISATASPGWQFDHWSDGSTVAQRVIEVTGNIELIATFSPIAPTRWLLTLWKEGEGEVIGAGTYDEGTRVDIAAIPAEGWRFVKWSDGNEVAERSIVVNSDIILTAHFAPLENLVVQLSTYGVGHTSGSGTYVYGDEVTIKALPDSQAEFIRWSDGSTEAERTFTITEDVILTAYFTIPKVNLTLLTEGEGEVYGGGEYDFSTKVAFHAEAAEGWHFDRWSDNVRDPYRLMILEDDLTLTAIFAENPQTAELTINVEGPGTASGAGTYLKNTTAHVTATAGAGAFFLGWENGSVEPNRDILMLEDTTIKATFMSGTAEQVALRFTGVAGVVITQNGVDYYPGYDPILLSREYPIVCTTPGRNSTWNARYNGSNHTVGTDIDHVQFGDATLRMITTDVVIDIS